MKHLLAVALATLFALPLAAQRLPRTVAPHHYDLTFAPDFAAEKFTGDAVIHVSIQQPVNEVVLHALEIEIHDATIDSHGKAQKAAVIAEPANEWVRLTVPERLAAGPATIRVRYTGILNRKLRGLYLGEANGRKYAATQMEATDARAAFPSFDEPELKATFAITTIVDERDAVISNGAEISNTPGPAPGKKTIRFATTPRMSTYLVALAIGDFKCISDELDGIPLRICGTPEKLPLGTFAMDATKVILKYFNDYYGIRYPFGKLDQIGVADFRAGAMENTGAVLYRDSALFVDPKTAPSYYPRGIANTISHEIAHMWFGDLVTMRWWDDIWLNEGFATWISDKPIEAWKPEWKVRIRQAGSSYAMNADALRTSRPVRQQAETPDQIDELFDGIAYDKAASILRMIESYIGEESFRKGVNHYIASRAYDNATFYDFADSLRVASNAPIVDVLTTFVEQPGVPLIRASSECRDGKTWLTLEQERFFLDPTPEKNSQRWSVPICFTIDGEQRCELLSDAKRTFQTAGCGPVHLNARARGYYVVQHSEPMLDAILGNTTRFDPTERMSLVRDEWSLVRSGRRSVADFLQLADAYRGENEPLVRNAVIGPFAYIRDYIATDTDREGFEQWVRDYLQPMSRDLGWVAKKGEAEDVGTLRANVIYTLGKIGDDPAIFREARKLLDGKREVDRELTDYVAFLAASGGDEALYEKFLSAMKAAKTPAEYYRYFWALSEFRDPALARRTLDFALSDEVKNQDAGSLISAVVGNPSTRDLAWNYIEKNWSAIEKKLPERMRGAILASARNYCDPNSLQRVTKFYEAHPTPSAARTMAQSLERIGLCIALKEKQSSNLHAWLMEQRIPRRQREAATSPRARTDKQRR